MVIVILSSVDIMLNSFLKGGIFKGKTDNYNYSVVPKPHVQREAHVPN